MQWRLTEVMVFKINCHGSFSNFHSHFLININVGKNDRRVRYSKIIGFFMVFESMPLDFSISSF